VGQQAFCETERVSDHAVPSSVTIEPWAEDDLELLRRINAPEMTHYLGGAESEEQVLARHRRYVALNGQDTGQVFRVVAHPDQVSAGSVGYWDHEWGDGLVAEVGWSILPPYQGRGFAVAAMRALITVASSGHRYARMHAFPRIENAASNAVCRRLGFTLIGEIDFEYPRGHPIRCHDWRIDLA